MASLYLLFDGVVLLVVAAIIRREVDQSVVCHTQLVQFTQHAAGAPVHLLHLVTIGTVSTLT